MYDRIRGPTYPRICRSLGIYRRSTRRALLPERRDPFTTLSGAPVNRLYTPADVADLDYDRDLGLPGRYPFTRGIHPTGYRGQAVDHAHVRRLRHRRGDQRALQVSAGTGADGALGRVRHAHALRL